jgi:hypothetical protein
VIWKREPALVIGVLQAVVALAVAFGFGLSAEQTGAILAVSAALLALVTRSQVTPVSKTSAEVDDVAGSD